MFFNADMQRARDGVANILNAEWTCTQEIADTLKQTWTRDTENRSVNWSLGVLKYAVY